MLDRERNEYYGVPITFFKLPESCELEKYRWIDACKVCGHVFSRNVVDIGPYEMVDGCRKKGELVQRYFESIEHHLIIEHPKLALKYEYGDPSLNKVSIQSNTWRNISPEDIQFIREEQEIIRNQSRKKSARK